MSAVYDAVVVGGGISGLTAAHELKKKGFNVCVLDANPRAGGLIQSVKEDGFLMENGPHTIPGRATELLALCQEFNLDLLPTNPLAKNRYIYLQNYLHALPSSPKEAIFSPLLSTRAKWRVLAEPWQPDIGIAPGLPAPDTEMTVADFFRQRLGDEPTDHLVDPFVSGIYAGDIDALSMPSVFPSIWAMQAEHGSLLKAGFQMNKAAYLRKQEEKKELAYLNKQRKKQGLPPKQMEKKISPRDLFSFKQGLQYLPLTMARALTTVGNNRGTVLQNIQVQSIRYDSGHYELTTDDGSLVYAARLVLAVPADVAARLLGDMIPLAAGILQQIPYVGMAATHTGFLRSRISHPLDGFGVLIPSRERMALLGSIWTSRLFPERAMEEYVLLTSYLGGARRPDLPLADEDGLLSQACRDLTVAFKPREPLKPDFSRVVRHPRAIPQYVLGHRARWQTAEWDLGNHPNLALCGNYLTGVALNDCVKSGIAAAEKVGR